MKVLVTGASGFLGSHIAEQFAAGGHEVRLLLRPTSSRAFLQFPYEVTTGDVTDPESLTRAAAGLDAIVHAAGLIKARNEMQFDAVNTRGTQNLIAAVDAAAPEIKRFVYISSLAAHGPSEGGSPRPLEAPARPLTAYGRTKLAGENLTRVSRLRDRAVIFRMPVIYGPRDAALLPFFRLARLRLAPLLMGGHNRISILYVEDAARAVVQATTAEAQVAGKTYCPEDGLTYTWRDLLGAIEDAAGHRALRIRAPRWAFSGAALVSEAFGLVTRRAVALTREKVREMAQESWVCSSETLRRDLGWSARVQVPEGTRLTYDWYRQNRWL